MSDVRVLVVGGGMAGVSLGCQLAADCAVTVLEAEPELAVHSTGRSAALFVPAYGPTVVQDLTAASAGYFEHLGSLPGSTPVLHPRGVLLTAWDEAAAAALGGLGLPELAPESAARLCPALRLDDLHGARFDERAADLDVMALHGHYLAGLRQRGGAVHTGARVVRARRTASGWELTSLDGRTFAGDVVVNAAGAWGDEVAATCSVGGSGLSARRRTVAIARPVQPVPVDMPVVADFSDEWYVKPEGGALLVSPGDETPVAPGAATVDPLDVALALERVNGRTTLGLRSVVTSWAGLRTFAADRVPMVGWHPEEDSVFCFLGQGGYGIQMAPELAAVGAALFRRSAVDPSLAAALSPGRAALLTVSP